MKYLKSIYDLLLEEIESYNWELVEDTNDKVRYTFMDTNNNRYLVEFKNIPRLRASKNKLGMEYEVTYYVFDESKEYYNVSKLVNVNPYNILKTVFGDILKDFIKRKSWVNTITMFGLAKEREKSYVSQRTKMYVRYLERNPINGYKLEYNGNNKISLIKI
jgi:hypothetical protein